MHCRLLVFPALEPQRALKLITMETPTSTSLSLSLLFFHFISRAVSSYNTHGDYIHCLSLHFHNRTHNNSEAIIYTPNNPLYSSVLNSSIQNLRFTTPATPRPFVIITPFVESHVQATVRCSRKHNVNLRIRGGGHDYKGLSYVAAIPFAILDLSNMRAIRVDVQSRTVWVQGGAQLGELYYHIANKSKTLGFPGGLCPTVGVGGHISGGGYSLMLRKHGLAADHVIDARLVDANGRILDRKLMGEDLFWAIRGGGGGNFGIVLAWKLELVPIPKTVTVFFVKRSLEQNATKLVHRWQYIADKMDENLYIRVALRVANSSQNGTITRTMSISFESLYLGRVNSLLPLMQKDFPELGLKREDCAEIRWIDAQLLINSERSLDDLLNRTFPYNGRFKIKSDYVTDPIPKRIFESIWKRLYKEDMDVPLIVLNPYGGKMSRISESSIPFPHRAGIRYSIAYLLQWQEEGEAASERHLSWIRRLYKYMTPHVSKNPRLAYVNYRDLDIGTNNRLGNTSHVEASVWGVKYFKHNFKRLVRVKTMVDPHNFFRNEQSIPPMFAFKLHSMRRATHAAIKHLHVASLPSYDANRQKA